MKDCSKCPSYLTDPDKIRDRFQKNIGMPVCGRFGIVLSYNDITSEDALNLRRSVAENCDSYDELMPPYINLDDVHSRVAEPDARVVAAGPSGLQVSTCHSCSNCIKHDAVFEESGWPLPLCQAKGELIFSPTKQSRDCPWASPGTPQVSMVRVELLPRYQKGFRYLSEKQAETSIKLSTTDPVDYKTDLPIDPDDEAAGIRAWRVIECPFGTGKQIPLPIFRRDFFDEHEQATIPSFGDEHHPELYIDYANLLWRFAVESWQLGNTLLIQSLPGLGKTEFTYWLAYLMQVPWTRIFFTDEMEWSDIFGKPNYKPDKGVYWTDGRFTAACRRPGIICVDEPNMAKSEIVATLRTSSEAVRALFLDAGIADDAEERLRLIVHLDPYCFPVWCSNPAWDPRNIGTKELAAADISRLSPAYLETPPEAIEKTIIKNTVKALDDWEISDDLLADVMTVSTDIRQLSKDMEYPGTWGIRENIRVARKLAWFPFVESYRMAALNYFEPETATMIIERSIKTIRGDDL